MKPNMHRFLRNMSVPCQFNRADVVYTLERGGMPSIPVSFQTT